MTDAELIAMAESSPMAYAMFCLYDPHWDREQCERVMHVLYQRALDKAERILGDHA